MWCAISVVLACAAVGLMVLYLRTRTGVSRAARPQDLVGAITLAYGAALCLWWAVALGWLVVNQGAPPEEVGVALVSAAVAALLIVTGSALYRARPRARLLSVATAILLGVKAAVAAFAAVGCLRDTGWLRDELRPVGWALLALVVAPSGFWALVLAGAVKLWALPPPEAADYDDAGSAGC